MTDSSVNGLMPGFNTSAPDQEFGHKPCSKSDSEDQEVAELKSMVLDANGNKRKMTISKRGCHYLERKTRLELATPTLARSCSTN